jgi:putative ABC transport system permease protein
MNPSIYEIPTPNLALVFLPLLVVFGIYARWTKNLAMIPYATARMLAQLLLVGFALVYLFNSKSPLLVGLVLCVMLLASGWIALHPIAKLRRELYAKALFSIAVGGLATLALVVVAVLRLSPWYEPRYLIPIAGMIFANTMNTVSLAAERFHAERDKGASIEAARPIAYRTSLLPMINAFFAVGIVSLPGMMTGQILSGISPLIAVRYQIMVMCMLLGSSGISAAIYLSLVKK